MSWSNLDFCKQTNYGDAGFPMDVLLGLDRSERRALSDQLLQQLRAAIQQGRLPADSVLPPSRVLARDLGVARSVVVTAYEQLVADGYVSARQGSGTRVVPVAAPVSAHPPAPAQLGSMIGFLGGLPDPRLFPRTEWLRHYRAALNSVPNQQLGYPGPLGAQQLREALVNYLGRVRGVAATADRVLISAGITQALTLLCRAMRSRGIRALGVEDPCFGLHRQAIVNAGLLPVPIPVDDDGLDVARLADLDIQAVLLAPAHSYPTGAVLNATRRATLIDWAHTHDGLIIEDDYDAEFRYDRTPIGALHGLSPQRVAYCGGVSKTLTPALRLGWMALPSQWTNEVSEQKLLDDMGTTVLEQLALARFIDTGGLGRHLRRVRPIYRRRRDATLWALSTSLPGAEPIGVAAGLHVYVRLPPWCDERHLIDAAAARGLVIDGARWHYFEMNSAPPALVLGYGTLDESAIRSGLATLGEIYRAQRSR